MSIQTQPGAPVLDATDFKHTHQGVTWGLKVRSVPTPDGSNALDVVIVEKSGEGWAFKELAVMDAETQLLSLGAAAFAAVVVVPVVNAWLKRRFKGGASVPAEVPATVPPAAVELDRLLAGLRVNVGADGVPQIQSTAPAPVTNAGPPPVDPS